MLKDDVPAPPVAVSTPPGGPPASALARIALPNVTTPVTAPPQRIRVGGNFQEARLLSGPSPLIPTIAKERRIYGVVKLEATIGKDGGVKDVTVLSGHPFLSVPAREAALKRRYQPATLNGEPLEVKVPIQIVFQPNP